MITLAHMDTHINRPPLALSKKEVCRELGGVCLRTVDSLIARKELACRKIGRRVVIPYSSLVQFLRRDHSGRELE
jgi:hypothetical protein